MSLRGREEDLSGVRLPEPLHHALLLRLTVHDRRNGVAQQGEYGHEQQNRRDGVMVPVEPVGIFQQSARQRIDCRGKQSGDQPGAERVQQPFPNEHRLQLTPGHAHGLQHGELPPPRQDGGHHGVEEIEHADDADDRAQQPAQHHKGHLNLPETGAMGYNAAYELLESLGMPVEKEQKEKKIVESWE